MDSEFVRIALKGWNKEDVSRRECGYMLNFSENSEESLFISSLADRYLKSVCDRTAILNVQIGIQQNPCPGNCRFCNFNKGTSKILSSRITDEDLRRYISECVEYGDVRTISLMTMQNYDMDHLIHCIKLTKQYAKDVNVTLNIGDVSYDDCIELKKAGATGAYHACRLREGTDTDLRPEDRIQTIRNYLYAGFTVSTCTEPIGPEHSVDEILDNYYCGMEIGTDSGSIMARVPVPNTPFGDKPVLSMERVRQIRATLFMASTSRKKEGSRIDEWDAGYFNGFNRFHAEYGCNPRDSSDRSEDGFGHTIGFARRWAFNSGYDKILRPDGKRAELDLGYLSRTGSL